MFAVSNKELVDAPFLHKTIKCQKCGKRHKIESGTSVSGKISLQSYKCGESHYLCGLNRKNVTETL